jgi:hypothetical protein
MSEGTTFQEENSKRQAEFLKVLFHQAPPLNEVT